jgi:hypothetical protein
MGLNYLFGDKYSASENTSGFFYIIGRVKSIVMSDVLEGTNTPDPNFTNFGDIGKIKFEVVYSSLATLNTDQANAPAYPIFSFMNQYPLINEIVIIFPGPSETLNDSFEAKTLFYLPPFNLWRSSPNHSAMPNLIEWSKQLSDIGNQPNYIQENNQQIQLFLGQYFKENNVRRLKPFEGDTILESRNGQSLRFGSTTETIRSSNNWSRKGSQGSPITMMINGQGTPNNRADSFAPTIENINKDASSLYLTYDQEIVLEDLNNFEFRSFGRINAQYQEKTSNVRMTSQPIISNEIVDANTQDKNSIG